MMNYPNMQYNPMQQLNNIGNQKRLPKSLPMIPGRVVQSEMEILPAEIPNDGTIMFFIKSDYTELYAKQWNANNNLDSLTYVIRRDDPYSQISDRLVGIEASIAKLMTMWSGEDKANDAK